MEVLTADAILRKAKYKYIFWSYLQSGFAPFGVEEVDNSSFSVILKKIYSDFTKSIF